MASVKYMWMAVTDDEFELPLSVRCTTRELGKALGLNDSSVVKMYFTGNVSKYEFNHEHYRIRRVVDE